MLHFANTVSLPMRLKPLLSRMSTQVPKIAPAIRASNYGDKDVWAIFTPLANQHKAVNLGQGFPNIPAPDFVKQAASDAIFKSNLNQYAPSKGLPHLRQSLAAAYETDFGGRKLDAETEILVTQGANQGIALAMQAFINPGDEVILIEPFFDIYKPCIEIVGGKVVTVPLRLDRPFTGDISANDWKLDLAEVEAVITPQTKAILLNTPHNPTGKVFNAMELHDLAKIVKKHNLLCISDDVYDRLYYDDGCPGIPRMANVTVEGESMWGQCITIGSGGKTFGVTGWRIGWGIGPASLLRFMLAVHARTVFTSPTPLQEAVASAFDYADKVNYFGDMRADYKRRRDHAISIFQELGLPVAIPSGSYFFMVNMAQLMDRLPLPPRPSEEIPNTMETPDYALCRWLTEHIGVTFIPPSAFYEPANKHLASTLVRVCFCKSDDTLSEARERLQLLKKYLDT